MPLVVAHLGHWYESLLYLLPIVIVALALGLQTLRDRRRGR